MVGSHLCVCRWSDREVLLTVFWEEFMMSRHSELWGKARYGSLGTGKVPHSAQQA